MLSSSPSNQKILSPSIKSYSSKLQILISCCVKSILLLNSNFFLFLFWHDHPSFLPIVPKFQNDKNWWMTFSLPHTMHSWVSKSLKYPFGFSSPNQMTSGFIHTMYVLHSLTIQIVLLWNFSKSKIPFLKCFKTAYDTIRLLHNIYIYQEEGYFYFSVPFLMIDSMLLAFWFFCTLSCWFLKTLEGWKTCLLIKELFIVFFIIYIYLSRNRFSTFCLIIFLSSLWFSSPTVEQLDAKYNLAWFEKGDISLCSPFYRLTQENVKQILPSIYPWWALSLIILHPKNWYYLCFSDFNQFSVHEWTEQLWTRIKELFALRNKVFLQVLNRLF